MLVVLLVLRLSLTTRHDGLMCVVEVEVLMLVLVVLIVVMVTMLLVHLFGTAGQALGRDGIGRRATLAGQLTAAAAAVVRCIAGPVHTLALTMVLSCRRWVAMVAVEWHGHLVLLLLRMLVLEMQMVLLLLQVLLLLVLVWLHLSGHRRLLRMRVWARVRMVLVLMMTMMVGRTRQVVMAMELTGHH